MKIAYFDCFSGISGDMTLGALLDAGASLEQVQHAIDSMGLEHVRLSTSQVKKNGFRALQLAIDHPPEHAHRHLKHIRQMIEKGDFSPRAKELANAIFHRIAVAEAKVHGTDIQKVHFHEVGAIDSIADIVGVAVAWESLGIDIAYSAPVPVGSGTIRIAHGLVSVPAPATAEILYGVPIASTGIEAELTTPTGAAILAELVTGFGPVPAMQWERIGYGAGSKDLPKQPNLLRLMIGTAVKVKPKKTREDDSVLVLETNLDDTTGEQISFANELLLQAGALDVFSTPIHMKKGRPGCLLTVLVRPEDREIAEQILFEQTGTLGIRYSNRNRTTLPRASIEVDTPWGAVRGKVSKRPDGTSDFSPEFDDCRNIAMRHHLRLALVFAEAIRQWEFTHADLGTASKAGPTPNDHAKLAPPQHIESGITEASSGSHETSGSIASESIDSHKYQHSHEHDNENGLGGAEWPTDFDSSMKGLPDADYFSSATRSPAQHQHPNPENEHRPEVFPGSRSYHGSSPVPQPHFRIDYAQEDSEKNPEDGSNGHDTPN